MINLIKLVVGVTSLEELAERQTLPANQRLHPASGKMLPVVRTRTFPKQADELLQGGSLYRVIAGLILCRQRLVDIQSEVRADGTNGTLLFVDPTIIRVEARALRPFQGWRYLRPADAPPDLKHGAGHDQLPPALQKELALLGL
ncbi:DUF1489 family protein [Acetobacter ghanensis]|uniref:DUF1489 family protein n=1 Tax=Acetobacter ghanensis TaxID=431306 RepID=A0A0U5BHC7_9PROT|nr:DUF1489 domain-containing protein [Acetobacter ghanensis]NHO39529.1 DUF1489 family protein [Acetobacter ghanensis]GBQ46183.1 hypothetical protein AA18895_0695 [Acetobacter ghanensis DSM 18895]CEF54708.1 hypothetical protein AGA_936 [Acetobacter ghanensis]